MRASYRMIIEHWRQETGARTTTSISMIMIIAYDTIIQYSYLATTIYYNNHQAATTTTTTTTTSTTTIVLSNIILSIIIIQYLLHFYHYYTASGCRRPQESRIPARAYCIIEQIEQSRHNIRHLASTMAGWLAG